ncbi:MAG: 3'-5' exonuclease [Bacteroidales bacterium]|nr:3'-5' exonuclease [Bacteroidales bacterium]
MKLQITRPIVFFDIESTGLNVGTDRIVEIAMLRIAPGGSQESLVFRLNPTIPIPPEVTAIHGISDADVADKPTFAEVAGQIVSFFKGADLGGYNSDKFDIPMLAEEFARAEVDIDLKKMRFVDVQVIFFKKEPRNLSAAYRFYCGKELVNAHSALADVTATWEIFQAQLERYPDLPPNIEGLSALSGASRFADFAGRIILDDKDEEVFNFGKYKGRKVLEVFSKEPQYYNWMMQKDFPEYTKRVITRVFLKLRQT